VVSRAVPGPSARVTYAEYADDDRSVFSQSSSKTPRKKLQPNWKFFGVKHKSESSSQQMLAESAALKMVKAGPIEEIRPGKNGLGGFRRAHVNDLLLFSVSNIFLFNCC
jgi:hypothetical protein